MLLTPSYVMFERPQSGSIAAAGVKEMRLWWAGPGELAPQWSLQGRVYCWSSSGSRQHQAVRQAVRAGRETEDRQ